MDSQNQIDISLALIPSLLSFTICSEVDSKEEVRKNTMDSIKELSEVFDVLISQRSLEIVYPHPSVSR